MPTCSAQLALSPASIIRPGLVASPGQGTAGLESEAELEQEGKYVEEKVVRMAGEK